MSTKKYNLLTEEGIVLTNGEIIKDGIIVEVAREVEYAINSGKEKELGEAIFEKANANLTRDEWLILKNTDVPSRDMGEYMESVWDLLIDLEDRMHD